MPQAKVVLPTYLYRLQFREENGGQVHELALGPTDFTRAMETAFFDGLRQGVYSRYEPPLGLGRIEPRFAEPDGGSPWTNGFTVTLPAPGGNEHRVEFGPRFFRHRAHRFIADLIRNKGLGEDTRLTYHLAAYLDGEEEATAAPGMEIEAASVEVPLRDGSRSALGHAEAWDDPRPEDMPVLIPRPVLEEAVEEARQAPGREVAGVLLGHLRHDPASADKTFLEITAQVPAEQTEATTTSVTFTAASWARVRQVVELRGEGEIFAGWVHSHPFRLCAECPLPVPAECIAKVLFYSSDDNFLMELSFARPFMVGLLTAVEPRLDPALGHLPVRLYGWRGGEIVPRGFLVIGGQ